ncbi:hypothetical protein [Pseudobacteriovorax antillogorgiicola]|uniref:Uncharacterized protein n=1 Tax=Pseudobacteriovorax antillogorgiicola TaxID=1513793 RepID=A0A1Y6CJC6_9BACT|nr:hypothetical protein [Pseudobacteriovorax antillogorgiicola]TCS48264.1 hypothetical protein EDD56_11844 [Pseudobacteriovorax antillogorgiicola]SMF57128.1 hypothetical protein SAMN06296036_11897 [Pseudobacteriovorax antillogorgiicola]
MNYRTYLKGIINFLDGIILIGSIATLAAWIFLGQGLLYSETSPVLSPFTSLSLALMSGSRLALKHLQAFPTPLAMAALGLTLGGNLSSIMAQLIVPSLLLDSFPSLVPTSIMTSVGLILFCCYELLVILRDTPRQGFIIDDILLHLALLPGGISLLGHVLDNPVYISSKIDPRSGISILEMAFMASYAVVAALSNKNLFLWRFLRDGSANRVIFAILFVNQYIAPTIVGLVAAKSQERSIGIELFVMLAGVFATLSFLAMKAFGRNRSQL